MERLGTRLGVLLLAAAVALPWLSGTPALAASSVRFEHGADLGFGETTTIWTRGAHRLDLEYTADGAVTFTVDQAHKAFPPGYSVGSGRAGRTPVPLPRTAVPTYRVRATASPSLVRVQWGFPAKPQEFTLRNESLGTLHVRAVWLRGPDPEVIPPTGRPLLAAMGDSLALGERTGGPMNSSGGYADRLSGRWTVANFAVGGTSATCYGRFHVGQVVAAQPAAVLVAYGTNDLTGDFTGCRGSIDEFRTSMDDILEQLHDGLPDASVSVGAILPRLGVRPQKLVRWNDVLQDVAADHGAAFVDTRVGFDPATMLRDGLHPNVAGHRHIAAIWNRSW